MKSLLKINLTHKLAGGALALLLLSSCSGNIPVFRDPNLPTDTILTPRPMLIRNLPKGDDSYSEGFRDGCNTMFGIVGTGYLRTLKINVNGYRMVEDKVYTRGWSDGATYCTFSLSYETH